MVFGILLNVPSHDLIYSCGKKIQENKNEKSRRVVDHLLEMLSFYFIRPPPSPLTPLPSPLSPHPSLTS